MKKGLIIFILAIMSWFSAFWYRGNCSVADSESWCGCKARDFDVSKPINQTIYQSCMSEESAKLSEREEEKQKLLEEKQKELEAKQAELEKKQKELEKKAEAMGVKAKSFPEAELAKSALGSKASIIESLVPIIKSKDSETQQKVGLILESFKASKDEYTRNVGIYLDYLLK